MHHSIHNNKENENNILAAINQNLAIIQFDTNRKVSYANQLFTDTMGYSSVADIIGLSHSVFCFDDFAQSPDYHTFWNKLLRGQPFQDKVIRKDVFGNQVWLEATYMPMIAENGRVTGVLKAATNITERQNDIANIASILQQTSATLFDKAEKGMQQQQNLHQKIDQIAAISTENTELLSGLKAQASEVKGIAVTIQNIASRTNILSLNAAIEAARAGEYGKGFDVVAKEIRKLSNQVQTSIEEVNNNIKNITDEITKISAGTLHVQADIENSTVHIKNALEGYHEIVASGESLKDQANKLTKII